MPKSKHFVLLSNLAQVTARWARRAIGPAAWRSYYETWKQNTSEAKRPGHLGY